MAALPSLMTVAQFRELPESGPYDYELHQGRLVQLTKPKARHQIMQANLLMMLLPKLSSFGRGSIELAYRAVGEFDLRAADVAFVSHARWKSMDPDDNLRGAPDLVIEVKSPSNTKRQLQGLASLCLQNGTIEFWVVDTVKQTITVVRQDGSAVVYRRGKTISLTSFGAGELSVAEVFDYA